MWIVCVGVFEMNVFLVIPHTFGCSLLVGIATACCQIMGDNPRTAGQPYSAAAGESSIITAGGFCYSYDHMAFRRRKDGISQCHTDQIASANY